MRVHFRNADGKPKDASWLKTHADHVPSVGDYIACTLTDAKHHESKSMFWKVVSREWFVGGDSEGPLVIVSLRDRSKPSEEQA